MRRFGIFLILGIILSLGACNKTRTNEGNDSVMGVANSSSANVDSSAPTITVTDGKPVVVDFSASWCPPCQQLKPIFASLTKEFEGRVTMVTVDVDENSDMAAKFDVHSIPTLIFFDANGSQQDRFEGFVPEDVLRSRIENLLNSPN